MKYKIRAIQKDLDENIETVIFEGIIDNLNEFSYLEEKTGIKTTVYMDEGFFELIRYGGSRTILHLEKDNSFAKVIDVNGTFVLDVKLVNIKADDKSYTYEYQIIQDHNIMQHFVFTLDYTTLFN